MTDHQANLTQNATGAIAWLRNRLSRRERESGIETGSASRLQYQRLQLKCAREVIAKQKGMEEDSCTAYIFACLEQGIDDRDEIIATVGRHLRISSCKVALLLDRKTGNDLAEHLWVKRRGQRYAILDNA